MAKMLTLDDQREKRIQRKRVRTLLGLSDCLLNLSTVAADAERWEFAMLLVHDARNIRADHLGDKSVEVAECLGAISTLHARQKRFDLAIRYGEEKLVLLCRCLGDAHPDTEAAFEQLHVFWRAFRAQSRPSLLGVCIEL